MLHGRRAAADSVTIMLSDRRRVLAVVGPAGIGKTTLVREVVEPDALWIRGVATLHDRPGIGLLQVLSAFSGDPELDASALLRHLNGRRLVLDDAHWTDPYTLSVVELAARVSRPVATWRTFDPSVPRRPPAGWCCYTLGPLDASDAQALARHVRPELSEPERLQLLDIAGGSPLLISLLGAGTSAAPNLLSTLVGRLQTLRAPVRWAALMVAAAEVGLPTAEAGFDPDVGEDLLRSGLVLFELDSWRPRHPLLRESLLEIAEPTELQEIHRRLADRLAARDPAAAARHAALAGDPTRAVRLAETATSMANGPVDKARATIGLADVLHPIDPDSAWRLRVEATSELRLHAAYSEVLCAFADRALPDLDVELSGMARINLASAEWEVGDVDRALAHAREALVLAQGTGGEVEVLALGAVALHALRVLLDGSTALPLAREALEMARQRGQHVVLARTILAAALLITGDPSWREEIDGAIAEAIADRDLPSEHFARETRYLAAFVTGDLEMARADLQLVVTWSAEGRLPPRPRVRANLLMVDLLSLRDRDTIVKEADRLLSEEPIFGLRTVAEAARAVAAIEMGRADLALGALSTWDPASPEEVLLLAWVRTELAWATGQAVTTVASAVAAAKALPFHPVSTITAVAAAWCCIEAGRDPPEMPVVALPGFAAAALEVNGLHLLADGDPRGAVSAFDEAGDRWRPGSDRRGILRCQMGAALAADQAGVPDASDRLQRCLEDARSIGSSPIFTRVRRALRDHGVRTPPFESTAIPPLSATQTQVLRLLAAGFTTSEVATATGVRRPAIHEQLQRALDRLDLRDESEALRWMATRS